MDSHTEKNVTGLGGAPSGASADGKPAPSQASNKRLQQAQAQVNEVVDIMRVNMEKVLERDDKLAQLYDRADALQAGASQFEASAGKLKNKYWWKNMKEEVMNFPNFCRHPDKKPEEATTPAPDEVVASEKTGEEARSSQSPGSPTGISDISPHSTGEPGGGTVSTSSEMTDKTRVRRAFQNRAREKASTAPNVAAGTVAVAA